MLPTSRRPMRGLRHAQQQQQLRTRRRLALGGCALLLGGFLYLQYALVARHFGGVSAPDEPPAALLDVEMDAKERARADPVAKGGAEPGPVHLRGDARAREPLADARDEEAAAHVMQLPAELDAAAAWEGGGELSFAEQDARRTAVRKAMQFAWENYEEHAFGGDEVDPKNGVKRANVWGDIACSLVDGMDTLWVMGLRDEFQRARDYVADKLSFDHLGVDGSSLSVFETIIREVGGLLSAYELSKDDVFKDKAKELVDLLTPAFEPDEGVFYTLFNPYTKLKHFASWSQFQAHIADVGTLQLEMRYLSDITGDSKYAEMGDAFYKILKREGSFKNTGLFPVHFDSTRGKFNTRSSTITLGALGDSFYEYLLKVYIYSGERKQDAFLREMYDDAVRGIEEHLLVYSEQDDLYFLQELKVPSFSAVKRMDHLLCFVPGLLALGTLGEKHDTSKNARHLRIAKQLMETCYQMYHRQPTGLSPDIVSFPNMKVYDAKYRLRPETIESLFYLYRVTGEHKYREYGWEIFQALEKHAKTEHGYGAVLDVTRIVPTTENKMESFFLAETLKYHYLLQAPTDLLPLDEFVFNTEAHPLRIRKSDV